MMSGLRFVKGWGLRLFPLYLFTSYRAFSFLFFSPLLPPSLPPILGCTVCLHRVLVKPLTTGERAGECPAPVDYSTPETRLNGECTATYGGDDDIFASTDDDRWDEVLVAKDFRRRSLRGTGGLVGSLVSCGITSVLWDH